MCHWVVSHSVIECEFLGLKWLAIPAVQVWLNAIQLTRHSFGDLDAGHRCRFSDSGVRSPKVGNRFACSRILQIICRGDMEKKLCWHCFPPKKKNNFVSMTKFDYRAVFILPFGENMLLPDWATQECKTSQSDMPGTCQERRWLAQVVRWERAGLIPVISTEASSGRWSNVRDGIVRHVRAASIQSNLILSAEKKRRRIAQCQSLKIDSGLAFLDVPDGTSWPERQFKLCSVLIMWSHHELCFFCPVVTLKNEELWCNEALVSASHHAREDLDNYDHHDHHVQKWDDQMRQCSD